MIPLARLSFKTACVLALVALLLAQSTPMF